MKRLTIYLQTNEWEAIKALSAKELRDIRLQIRMILREQLFFLGFLKQELTSSNEKGSAIGNEATKKPLQKGD